MSAIVKNIPSVSVAYSGDGRSSTPNELGMRPMKERAWLKRAEKTIFHIPNVNSREREEAIQKVIDETIGDFSYDPKAAQLLPVRK